MSNAFCTWTAVKRVFYKSFVNSSCATIYVCVSFGFSLFLFLFLLFFFVFVPRIMTFGNCLNDILMVDDANFSCSGDYLLQVDDLNTARM